MTAFGPLPTIEEMVRDRPGWLDEVASPAETSHITNVPVKTLESMRSRGGGPPFVRLTPGKRGRVGYRRRDLFEWLATRVRRSTSDLGSP